MGADQYDYLTRGFGDGAAAQLPRSSSFGFLSDVLATQLIALQVKIADEGVSFFHNAFMQLRWFMRKAITMFNHSIWLGGAALHAGVAVHIAPVH